LEEAEMSIIELNELAQPAKAAEVIQLVSQHIAEYEAGGPDREEEDVAVAEGAGLRADGVRFRWRNVKLARAAKEAAQPEEAAATAPAAPAPDEVAQPLSEQEIGLRKEAEALAGGGLSFLSALHVKVESAKAEPGAASLAERMVAARKAEPKPEPEEAEPEPEGEPAAAGEEPEGRPSTALVVAPSPALFMAEAELVAVREMNDKHAVISNLGGKCVVMEWAPSAITPGAKELSYQSFASFRERYANRYIDLPDGRGRIESVSQAPLWLSHPQRRQYEGLDLVPNGPEVLPGGYLNLWRGWGVVPRRGSWRLMERHIAEVLADGDQKFEDYIRMLTAWKFQNPGLPPEVVVALLGGKGAGQGCLGLRTDVDLGPTWVADFQHGSSLRQTQCPPSEQVVLVP
jgi:hypothetical protein